MTSTAIPGGTHYESTFSAVKGRAIATQPEPSTIQEGLAYQGERDRVAEVNGAIDSFASLAQEIKDCDNQPEDLNSTADHVVVVNKVRKGTDPDYDGEVNASAQFQPPASNNMLPRVLSMEVDNSTPSEFNHKWTVERKADGEHLVSQEFDGDRLNQRTEIVLDPSGKTLTYLTDYAS